MKKRKENEQMDSVFFDIHNSEITEEEFKEIQNILYENNFCFDISEFDYWKNTQELWYVWNPYVSHDNRDEAIERLHSLLEPYKIVFDRE